VLIHEVADQIGRARQPARPFPLLIRGDKARLCLQPCNIGWVVRIPQLVDERASAGEFGIAVDQD
jgi:hypothetical protein